MNLFHSLKHISGHEGRKKKIGAGFSDGIRKDRPGPRPARPCRICVLPPVVGLIPDQVEPGSARLSHPNRSQSPAPPQHLLFPLTFFTPLRGNSPWLLFSQVLLFLLQAFLVLFLWIHPLDPLHFSPSLPSFLPST